MTRAAPPTAALHGWPVEALWSRLEPLCPGLSVEWLPTCDSTNTRLMDRARRGDTAPCLLVTPRQTAGRGRLGRRWISAATLPGGDDAASPDTLTFSLGLALAPADWQGLSLAVGVAIAEALPAAVRVKWPNDLWCLEPDRKLGGVLIETATTAGPGRYVVVGVGLNLTAPAGLDAHALPAAGLRELEPGMQAADLLLRVAEPLLAAVLQFEREGFAAFATRYAARDALAGRTVRAAGQPEAGDASPGSQAVQGRVLGVADDGALRLETERGPVAVRSGDVSVRPC